MAKLISVVQSSWIQLALIVLTSTVLSMSGQSEANGSEIPSLFDTSQAFVKAYNAQDYKRIEAFLSPGLRKIYSSRKIAEEILKCKEAFRETILRTSLPASGSRFWGFFAVYGEKKTTSMLMEIDEHGKIVAFMMGDSLLNGERRCGFLN